MTAYGEGDATHAFNSQKLSTQQHLSVQWSRMVSQSSNQESECGIRGCVRGRVHGVPGDKWLHKDSGVWERLSRSRVGFIDLLCFNQLQHACSKFRYPFLQGKNAALFFHSSELIRELLVHGLQLH